MKHTLLERQFKVITFAVSKYFDHLDDHLKVRQSELLASAGRYDQLARAEAMSLALRVVDKPISLPFRFKEDGTADEEEHRAKKLKERDEFEGELFRTAEGMYEWLTQDTK